MIGIKPPWLWQIDWLTSTVQALCFMVFGRRRWQMCLRVTVLLTVCCIRHFNASTTSLWNRLEILTPKFLRLFFLLRILTSFSVEYSHLIISRYSNMPNVHLKGLLVPFIEGIYIQFHLCTGTIGIWGTHFTVHRTVGKRSRLSWKWC